MAIPSSQSTNSEIHGPYRLLMSSDLFTATIKGDRAELIRLLKLEPDHVEVPIEAPHPGLQLDEPTDVQLTTEPGPHSGDTKKLIRTPEAELRSVRFGDTVLHLLVNRRHNELALMVFKKDTSLLKLKNGKSAETPLHYAAKAGNKEVIQELIRNNRDNIVTDALEERNENGDTALHVATKQGHKDCVLELVELNKEILYTVNNEKLSPIHIATTKGYTELVKHFMKNYPEHAEFLDSRGRNIFHIAAEENQEIIFSEIFSFGNKEMAERMNNAVDYDGNTPMHIAARKGHTSIVRAIWENKSGIGIGAETVLNNEGLTPFEVSLKQLASDQHFDGAKISKHLRTGVRQFTKKWFHDVVGPPIADKWEKIQVIGLGSVLITTITFAAAFTIPGGYDQEHGTPILGRKYIFRLFVIANSLAFIQGFLSLFALLGNAMEGPSRSALAFAFYTFIQAASTMVVAFGLGIYVTLAPISLPLAIIILVITVFLGSPFLFSDFAIGQNSIRVLHDISEFVMSTFGIWAMHVLSIGIILGLGFL